MSSSAPGLTLRGAMSPSLSAAVTLRRVVSAASRLEPFDPDLARETYLIA